MKKQQKKIRLLRAITVLVVTASFLTGCSKSENSSPNDEMVTHNRLKVNSGNADAAFNGFNSAFLVNNSYYTISISNRNPEGTWGSSLDIMVAEDAYERTGNAAQKTLVNNLCTSWLQRTPPPWTWDGWNDDIGWFTMALIRGYQMTGTANFLTQARYGFDLCWSRGWDTQYNGGGIWEQQPDMTPAGQTINKQALSNNSLGKVACMIYQSNHDQWYLDRAVQIYDWVWNHLYNSGNGQVYTAIDRSNNIDKGTAVYNQGTFVDFANLLYQITGNVNYYNDAKRSIDYVKNNMTTGGIITNSAGYLNTWADEFARGLGHFARDNRQWGSYYSWMQQNATAIWNNRRSDYNITWNGWDQITPTDNSLIGNKFASAAAWMQYSPGAMPNNIGGMHFIVSKQNGIAIDNGGQTTDGAGIIQRSLNHGQAQKWNFTQNEDNSWNIINQQSWKALDVPGGNAANGTQIVQWTYNRGDNQRWWVDIQPDGSYKIWNKATGSALDNSSSSVNGFKLIEWTWSGGVQQLWLLQ